jgi:hypothetical protein
MDGTIAIPGELFVEIENNGTSHYNAFNLQPAVTRATRQDANDIDVDEVTSPSR